MCTNTNNISAWTDVPHETLIDHDLESQPLQILTDGAEAGSDERVHVKFLTSGGTALSNLQVGLN